MADAAPAGYDPDEAPADAEKAADRMVSATQVPKSFLLAVVGLVATLFSLFHAVPLPMSLGLLLPAIPLGVWYRLLVRARPKPRAMLKHSGPYIGYVLLLSLVFRQAACGKLACGGKLRPNGRPRLSYFGCFCHAFLPRRRIAASGTSVDTPYSPGRFGELIHPPLRLRICASLAPVQWAEFSQLRDARGVADSFLSKHVKQLADAGYVSIDKFAKLGRRHTRVSLTREGRTAYVGHGAALREMIA